LLVPLFVKPTEPQHINNLLMHQDDEQLRLESDSLGDVALSKLPNNSEGRGREFQHQASDEGSFGRLEDDESESSLAFESEDEESQYNAKVHTTKLPTTTIGRLWDSLPPIDMCLVQRICIGSGLLVFIIIVLVLVIKGAMS